jgi:hypothetical protein
MSVIYPVGFLAGSYRPAGDTERSFVRAGRVLHSIGIVDLELWAAAHGPAPQGTTSWARVDVLAAYRAGLAQRDSAGDGALPSAADIDNAVSDAAFDRLIARGLLVEVVDAADLGTDAPVSGMTHLRFAETHRFRGLLGGLGQSQDDPGQEIVGAPSRAVAMIEQSLYGLWQLAGQAESLVVAAEQIVDEASEAGDAVSIEECLERLLPDLTRLVSQNLGYFDDVPHNDGPLSYLTLEHVPIDLTTMEELRAMTENRLLTEGEYRSKLSGAPQGLMYLVEDPKTGKDVGYAGFASGALFDTIASLEGRTPASMVEQARRQLAAAGKYPLVWHVQQPDDVENVRQILQEDGITEIEVRHTPVY